MSAPGDDIEKAISIDMGEDGVAASHPLTIDFPRNVAPSLAGEKTFNTVKEMLTVVGCISLPNSHFDFDSSFLRPESKDSFVRLHAMREDLAESLEPDAPADTPQEQKTRPPLSVFGHADPVGQDDYNSRLSRRRAKAVYGVLTRNVALWEQLMNSGFGGDTWGKPQTDVMHQTVFGDTPSSPGSLDRKALIRAYMDRICVRKLPDGSEQPYQLDKGEDFLAGGADANFKGDVQGCGEYNPTLILSDAKMKAFEADKQNGKADRDAAYEIDRRVIAFMFKPGSRIDPKKWPCPHIHQDNAPSVCTQRFWTDAAQRRKADPDMDKRFGKEAIVKERVKAGEPLETVHRTPTFGCRFYHGIAQNSPCEGIARRWVVRVLTQPPLPGKPLASLAQRRFVVKLGDTDAAPIIRGKTDDKGFIRLPAFDEHVEMQLKLDVDAPLPKGVTPAKGKQADPKDESRFSEFILRAGALEALSTPGTEPADPQSQLAAKQRLYNLGYGPGEFDDWDDDDLKLAIHLFQVNHKLPRQDGKLDAPTRERLRAVHDHLRGDTVEDSLAEDPAAAATE